jgi:insulysin
LTYTNYHFSISNSAYDGAIDRFSQFFISPLFTADVTDREMNAVDSEWKMSLQSDFWKMYGIYEWHSDPNSYLHHFNCGNLETLKQEGIRDKLMAFHSKWYSSNIMTLLLVNNKSIKEMEELAVKYFSPIVDK